MFKTLIFFLFAFILYSCDIGSVDMDKVNQEIENRIKTQKIKKTIECTEKARAEAEIFVDSIITEITKNSINNDLSFPERPSRDTLSKYYEVKLDSVNISKLLDSMTNTK